MLFFVSSNTFIRFLYIPSRTGTLFSKSAKGVIFINNIYYLYKKKLKKNIIKMNRDIVN